MKIKLALGAAMLVGGAGLIEGQPQLTSQFDHVSLVSADVARAREWYVTHIGGKAGSRPDHVWYGKTWMLIILAGTPLETLPPGQKAHPKPSAGGALDHLSFSYPDVDAKVRELQAAGVKIVRPPRMVPGWFKTAFIEDPDGTSIELVEDRNRLGFHHVHVHTAAPEVEMSWLQTTFGGSRTKIRGFDALDYGEMKLIVERDANAVPSHGHAIDHLCFLLPRLDDLLTGVQAKGTKVTSGPASYGNAVVKGDMAWFDSPTGTKIEVLTRTPDYLPPK